MEGRGAAAKETRIFSKRELCGYLETESFLTPNWAPVVDLTHSSTMRNFLRRETGKRKVSVVVRCERAQVDAFS